MLAQLKQEDVFKSISENVGSTADPKVFYAVILGAAALVLLLVVINARRKREVVPRAVNHQGKLMKEVLKRVPLKSGELKQLKVMAGEQGYESPLTLVLCPSLLAKGVNEKGRADKKVIMGIARKMGIVKKK